MTMITLEEAIKNREKCLQYLEALGSMATPENVEAVRWSVKALREYAEKPPCYLEEKDDPYPLCVGRGFANCAHCCLWADFEEEQDESRVNPPLTLEQLRGTTGEPVWCEDLQCWGIVKCETIGNWANIPLLVGAWHHPQSGSAVNFQYDIGMQNLTLYRHKPEAAE